MACMIFLISKRDIITHKKSNTTGNKNLYANKYESIFSKSVINQIVSRKTEWMNSNKL